MPVVFFFCDFHAKSKQIDIWKKKYWVHSIYCKRQFRIYDYINCLLSGVFTGRVIEDGILVCAAMQHFLEITLNSHPSKFLVLFPVLLGKHIPNRVNHSNVKHLVFWLALFLFFSSWKHKYFCISEPQKYRKQQRETHQFCIPAVFRAHLTSVICVSVRRVELSLPCALGDIFFIKLSFSVGAKPAGISAEPPGQSVAIAS